MQKFQQENLEHIQGIFSQKRGYIFQSRKSGRWACGKL